MNDVGHLLIVERRSNDQPHFYLEATEVLDDDDPSDEDDEDGWHEIT